MNDQQRAAMQMALEALEAWKQCCEPKDWPDDDEAAITAMREALAQPQEPLYTNDEVVERCEEYASDMLKKMGKDDGWVFSKDKFCSVYQASFKEGIELQLYDKGFNNGWDYGYKAAKEEIKLTEALTSCSRHEL